MVNKHEIPEEAHARRLKNLNSETFEERFKTDIISVLSNIDGEYKKCYGLRFSIGNNIFLEYPDITESYSKICEIYSVFCENDIDINHIPYIIADIVDQMYMPQ